LLGQNASSLTYSSLRNISHVRVARFKHYFAQQIINSENNDWAMRIRPHEQLQCHLWAARNDADTSINRSLNLSPLFSGVPLHSLCSVFLSCRHWRRGTYSTALSSSRLERHFETLLSSLHNDDTHTLLWKNLIHGEHNLEEYRWLEQRLHTSHASMTADNASKRFDVRSLFQGGELTLLNGTSHHHRRARTLYAFRPNGARAFEVSTPFSVIDTLAILHHRATASELPLVPRSKKDCVAPIARVLLITGDSISLQLFWRLVHLVRRGGDSRGEDVLVPFRNKRRHTRFHVWPSQPVRSSFDLVLAIHETHDELLSFTSLIPYATIFGNKTHVENNDTLNSYMIRPQSTRQRSCGGAYRSAATPPASPLALFYLVFLWDPISARPRTDALVPCIPKQPMSDEFLAGCANEEKLRRAMHFGASFLPKSPIVPLRSLGVRIGMHVHGSNMWERRASPSAFRWLTMMATNCTTAKPPSSSFRCLHTRPQHACWAHPQSADTHFYLLTPIIRRPKYGLAHFIAPLAILNASAFPTTRLLLPSRSVRRTAHHFAWHENVLRMKATLMNLTSKNRTFKTFFFKSAPS
jgi:hypothetical protein